MERASNEFPSAPLAEGGGAAIHGTNAESSIPARLLIVLLLQAAAFALASASGKMPEFAVILFRALLIF